MSLPGSICLGWFVIEDFVLVIGSVDFADEVSG